MKLYTKRGDQGQTDLFGGERVDKDDLRVAAYGEVDELNAAVGLAYAAVGGPPWRVGDEGWRQCVCQVQELLFVLGSELATPKPSAAAPAVSDADVAGLERWIDQACAEVPPLRNFVLPGGCELAARFHLARTVCRRAERQVVALARTAPPRRGGPVSPAAIVFLNRLSDLLFAWARLANHRAAAPEVIWRPRESPRVLDSPS